MRPCLLMICAFANCDTDWDSVVGFPLAIHFKLASLCTCDLLCAENYLFPVLEIIYKAFLCQKANPTLTSLAYTRLPKQHIIKGYIIWVFSWHVGTIISANDLSVIKTYISTHYHTQWYIYMRSGTCTFLYVLYHVLVYCIITCMYIMCNIYFYYRLLEC